MLKRIDRNLSEIAQGGLNESQEKTLFDEHICLTDRLKAVLPNSPADRDALNLVELVLDSPVPPAKFAALSLLLGGLCPEPGEREATAEEWRAAASEVTALCEYTFAEQMLELGLYEHALLVDSRPVWQMFSVSQHLVFAGLPPVHLAAVLPSIDFDRTASNAFDVAYARVVIADRVRSVCIEALHATHSLRRFADWSIDDLECGLLAIRMSYTVFRRRLDGLESTPERLIDDFNENCVQIWRGIVLQLDSISVDRHQQKLPQLPAWREFVPFAIARHLQSLADGSELRTRGEIAAICAMRGFQ